MNKRKNKNKPNLQRRVRKAAIRNSKIKEMAEYLASKGWEIKGDYCSIADWGEGSTGFCHRTITQAYKIQQKLDSAGYVRPAGIDTDLTASFLDD